MIPFSLYFESYDTVKDFISNPVHNNKERKEWMQGFKDSGGKFLGGGAYGEVYSHPKWPYVVKMFNIDDPYVKYLRWAQKNPHPAFPKIYGLPKRVVPPYKRLAMNDDRFYAVRVEKLNPISDETWNLLNNYRWGYIRWKYMKNNPEAGIDFYGAKTYPHVMKHEENIYGQLPPNVQQALEGFELLNNANSSEDTSMGADDWKKNNIMQRDNGEIVLIDPVWQGYNHMAEMERLARMEYEDPYAADEYDDTPERIAARGPTQGGKRFKKLKQKKVTLAPNYYPNPKVSGDDDDDDIPF